jgi:hypothetical protein
MLVNIRANIARRIFPSTVCITIYRCRLCSASFILWLIFFAFCCSSTPRLFSVLEDVDTILVSSVRKIRTPASTVVLLVRIQHPQYQTLQSLLQLNLIYHFSTREGSRDSTRVTFALTVLWFILKLYVNKTFLMLLVCDCFSTCVRYHYEKSCSLWYLIPHVLEV